MIRLIQRRLIVPRGDTGTFSIPVLAGKDTGDVSIFTIFDPLMHRKIFEKVMTISGETLTIEFTHGDTVNLPVGQYVWDIKFYTDPIFAEEKLIGGTEVDSYYAAFTLPVCEIRETGDNLLMSDDAPTGALKPGQIDFVTASINEMTSLKNTTTIRAAEAGTSAQNAAASAQDALDSKVAALAAEQTATSAAQSAQASATLAAEKADQIATDLESKADKSEIPTLISQLENDSGYLTQETDPTVPAWAKAQTKPIYTANEVGAPTIQEMNDGLAEKIESFIVNLTYREENHTVTSDKTIDSIVEAYKDKKNIQARLHPIYGNEEESLGFYSLSYNIITVQRTPEIVENTVYFKFSSDPTTTIIMGASATGYNEFWIMMSANYLSSEPTFMSLYSQNNNYDADNNKIINLANPTNNKDAVNKQYVDDAIPTNVSELTNDAGYLTQHQDISGKANSVDLAAVATSGSYNDLLNKPTNVSAFTNDTGYLTSFTETDPTVPAWAKATQKPTYTASEVGAPTVQEMNSAISTAIGNVNSFDMAVVQALPEQDISTHTIYLVPKIGETNDVYDEYIYINNNWEMVGNTQVDLSNYATLQDIPNVPVQDVQVNSNSILNNGIANIPMASLNNFGVVKVNPNNYGIGINSADGGLYIGGASDTNIKEGIANYRVIFPSKQHQAVFYGLAKAAGDTTQSQSNNAVGTYTAEAKTAIQQMLDVPSTSDIPDISSKADKDSPVLTGSISLGRKENTTIGNGSTAIGLNNEASGAYSHAEGSGTTATGHSAHVEGSATTASGTCSHAEGLSTRASGYGSHTEGVSTMASGTSSHAENSASKAYGQASHAEGVQTIANGIAQHTGGMYNVSDTSAGSEIERGTYIEIIGNGTADNARSNARALDWNGNGHYMGNIYVGANADSTGGTKVLCEADFATDLEIQNIINGGAGA